MPFNLYLMGGVAAVCLIVGAGGAWKVKDMLEAQEKLHAAQAVIKGDEKAMAINQAQAAATQSSETQAVRTITKIQTITKVVNHDIPTYITPSTDLSYPIPYGAIRLLDASIYSADPASLTLPPGVTDATPSPVKASALAATLSDDIGECQQALAMTKGWQDWARAEKLAK